MSFAAVREPAHACFGLETPGPIRKRPLSAEFPPVPPRPACVAVPWLALERRYPRAALGVFACDLALDPVRPRIGSECQPGFCCNGVLSGDLTQRGVERGSYSPGANDRGRKPHRAIHHELVCRPASVWNPSTDV